MNGLADYGTWSAAAKRTPTLALVPKKLESPSFGCKFLEGQRVSVIFDTWISVTKVRYGYVKRVFAIMPRNDKRWVNTKPGYMVVVELDGGNLWYGSEEDLARDVYKASLAQQRVREALTVVSPHSASRNGSPNSAA